MLTSALDVLQHQAQGITVEMREQLQNRSFLKFQASHFSSDEVNRMGIHKTVMGQSDDLWAKGKSIMEYILKRGGRMGSQFQMRDVELTGSVKTEVRARFPD